MLEGETISATIQRLLLNCLAIDILRIACNLKLYDTEL